MNYLLTLLLLSTSTAVLSAPLTCPSVTWEELQTDQKDKGDIKVIFFASWCVGCKPHLTRTQEENTIFVVAFDEQERAEKTLNSFAVKQPCYTSDSTAAKY